MPWPSTSHVRLKVSVTDYSLQSPCVARLGGLSVSLIVFVSHGWVLPREVLRAEKGLSPSGSPCEVDSRLLRSFLHLPAFRETPAQLPGALGTPGTCPSCSTCAQSWPCLAAHVLHDAKWGNATSPNEGSLPALPAVRLAQQSSGSLLIIFSLRYLHSTFQSW